MTQQVARETGVAKTMTQAITDDYQWVACAKCLTEIDDDNCPDCLTCPDCCYCGKCKYCPTELAAYQWCENCGGCPACCRCDD